MIAAGALAVTRRELQVASRRWTAFLVRLAYLAAIALLLYDYLPRLAWRRLEASDLADFGRGLFHNFSALQYALVSLTAALAGCDLIAGEARRGTLGLLGLSPLSGRAIAVGKWQAAMAQTGLLCFAGAPVLDVCVFLGGVGVLELFGTLVMTLVLAALCSVLAVYFSSFLKRGWSALICTALALAAWHFIVGLPTFVLAMFLDRGEQQLAAMLCFALMPSLAAAATLEIRPGFDVTPAWITCAVLASLYTYWLLGKAGRRIEARVVENSAPPPLPTSEDELSPRFKSSRLGLFAPKGEVWDHDPLLWKERRIHGSGFLGADFRQMLLLLVPVSIYFACIVDRDARYYLPFWWAPVLLPLAVFNGVSLFAGEKEGRRWEVLLSTPLTPRQIVRGKLLGGFIGTDLLVPFIPLALLVAVFDGDRAGDIVLPTLVGGVFLAYTYVVSAAAGLHCATVRGAVTLAVLLLAATVAAPELYGEFIGRDAMIRRLARIANPAEVLDRLSSSWADPRSSNELVQNYFAYYAVGIAFVLAWILAAFDRFAGRGRTR